MGGMSDGNRLRAAPLPHLATLRALTGRVADTARLLRQHRLRLPAR